MIEGVVLNQGVFGSTLYILHYTTSDWSKPRFRVQDLANLGDYRVYKI